MTFAEPDAVRIELFTQTDGSWRGNDEVAVALLRPGDVDEGALRYAFAMPAGAHAFGDSMK